MGGFFKSKSFIVLLTLLILLCGVPTILGAMGQGSAVKDGVMAVVTPMMRGARALGDALSGFGEYFTEFDRLKEENRLLSERVKELEEQVYNAELLEKENEWMRTYLGAKRAHTDFVFCDANLIGSEAATYISSFTLDRGSASGIAVGMPVVTADGIVGRVTEVGLTFCRVSTIINYDSSVGAYVERSGEVGIVSGDFTRRRDGLCLLEYIAFDADIEVGDKIYSSGLGSVYPRDLYIGEITEVTGDAYNHTKVALVKPAVDLSDITKVMILTDYTVYTPEEN
ncbi:MAG: rod shape-determining protein MreC [Clostridia bacterium]|nr:rod shape-determining protein MreC [Clostridia bacterium]